MRLLWAALALGCAAVAIEARAQSYPFLDGNSQVRQMCSRPQGTGITAPQVPCDGQVWVGWAPSGIPPVTGTLTGTGTSASLPPLAGRPISGSISITGTATVQVEAEAMGDSTFYPISNELGQQKLTWQTNGTATVTATFTYTEPRAGTVQRWHVTACSGCTVTYRLEQ